MSDLLIFDPDDNLLTVLSNEADEACPFWNAPFREVLNQGSFFEFTAPADHEDSPYLVAENQVAFMDKDGNFQLFIIKEPEKINGVNGPQIHCVCEPWINELNDEPLEDIRPYNTTLKDALTRFLAKTRVKVGEVADLGLNSTNGYYTSVTKGIENCINTWGGELRPRIVLNAAGNKIAERILDVPARRGEDTGKRWEIDKDILSISHKVQSYPKTALYGRGASLETENGGFTRKITFKDVEWKVSKGDPVDKPLGQEWVGDPEALLMYGRKNEDGSRRHRYGFFEDGEIEDPVILLQKTWEALQQQKHPIDNFGMDVFLLEEITGYEHEKVRLGDTTFAIDRSFAKPIEVEERVIVYEYDVADPDNTGYVELGQYIDLYSDDDRIEKIEAILNDKSGIWDKDSGPITDDRIVNIVPDIPSNVTANGLFQSIMLEWDFNNSIYIANYEVYASKVKGFTPDTSNLVWRGKSSSYAHKSSTNEQWYFRVRAINTHGVAGPFSAEVSAETARVLFEDIEKGVTDAINESKEEAREALERANQATADAQEAIGQAQTAFDEAVNAHNTADAAKTSSDNASRIAGESYTLAETAKSNAATALTDAQKALSDVANLDQSVQTQFTNINGQLSSKVSQTTFNTLQGTVNTHTTQISQNATDISLKADKNYVDTIKGTVDSHSTLISQHAESIGLKASQSSVDTLTGRVSTAEANIGINAQAIESKMSIVEANAKFVTQSQLTQTSGSLSSRITAVQTNLDNIQIGGRNFLLGTADKHLILDSPSSFGTVSDYSIQISNDFAEKAKGQTVTLSVDILSTGLTEGTTNPWLGAELTFDTGGERRWLTVQARNGVITDGLWHRYTKTLHIPDNATNFRTSLIFLIRDIKGYVEMRQPKLEIGTKATDWTPAPEDMATVIQFSTLEQTVNGITTRVGNAEGNISSLQQTANSLSSRVGTVEGNISTLTQTAQGLQTQVNSKADSSTVTQLAGVVDTKLSSTDAAKTYATQSQLTQTSSSLTSTITKSALSNDFKTSRKTISTSGWYRIASNVGNRAFGEFTVKETYSGKHLTAMFTAGITYGRNPSYTLTGFSNYGSQGITKVRIVYNSTYDPPYVELYIVAPATVEVWCTKNIQESGWQLVDLTNGSIPTGYTSKEWDINENNLVDVTSQNVSKDTANVNGTPASQITSSITQLSDAINLRVSKDDVINQINVSTEGILIAGNKIRITGQTTIDNGVIKTAQIGDLAVTSAKIGNLAVDTSKIANLAVTGAKIANATITDAKIANLNASKINAGVMSADRISGGTMTGAKWQSDSNGSPFEIYIGSSSKFLAAQFYVDNLNMPNSKLTTNGIHQTASNSTPHRFYIGVNQSYNPLTLNAASISANANLNVSGQITTTGTIDSGVNASNGYFRYAGNTTTYLRVGNTSAALYVNGATKASWSSMPKVSLEPSGDGIYDGKEFGANNPSSMQPILSDYFFGILVEGEKTIYLDDKFLEYVSWWDIFISAGTNITLKEKGVDNVILEGNGICSFFFAGIQRNKESVVGYNFVNVEDEYGQPIRDFTERRINRGGYNYAG